ncbi:MAG: hypothetical protein ABF649_20490 [Bacillus sp. (in: firmicutes)]
MMAWMRLENEICIKKLPEFRNYLQIHNGSIREKSIKFVIENNDYFSTVLSRHTKSATGEHLVYLDKVTAAKGKYQRSVSEVEREGDRVYYGILPDGVCFADNLFDGIYGEDDSYSRNVETLTPSSLTTPSKQNRKNEKIYLTKKDYELFESFFQYGDFENADLVFVGKEEGLDRKTPLETFHNQINLFQSHSEGFGYIRKAEDVLGGFYIKNLELTDDNSVEHAFDATMRLQTRIKYNIDKNFPVIENLRQYRNDVLHRPNSRTAMFDFFPLPKQGSFPYILDSCLPFYTERTYRDYQKSGQSKRKKLIKEMYDSYPLKLSWVYTGISNGNFILKDVYVDFGFVFQEYNTSMVHPNSKHIVSPNLNEPKTFLIGERKMGSKTQYAIISPFLSSRQLSDDDVDVITTWAKAILDLGHSDAPKNYGICRG